MLKCWAQYGHCYARTEENGCFSVLPYPRQLCWNHRHHYRPAEKLPRPEKDAQCVFIKSKLMSGAVCLGQHNYAYYICRSRISLVLRHRCGMLMRVITGRPPRLSLSRRRDFLTSNITLWFQIIRCTRMMEYSSTRLLYSTKSIRPQQILDESIVLTGEIILTPTPTPVIPRVNPWRGTWKRKTCFQYPSSRHTKQRLYSKSPPLVSKNPILNF